jgi:hypothetical protein
MACGPGPPGFHRRAAGSMDTILEGRRPGDLPVQQPEHFRLVVNLQAARALQLTLPRPLVRRADRMTEQAHPERARDRQVARPAIAMGSTAMRHPQHRDG